MANDGPGAPTRHPRAAALRAWAPWIILAAFVVVWACRR
jgi:lactate permease